MLKSSIYSVLFLLFFLPTTGQINNLIHPEGYKSSRYESLGKVDQFGNGPKDMIMIAGWGFDGSVFENFISTNKEKYTMYVITLPGFGETQAYPMPTQNENYSDLHWTNGIISGIKKLITTEKLNNPLIFSYFTYSNIIALRMALDYPDIIDRVIIVSGMAKFMANYPSYEPRNLNERIYFTEEVVAKKWFKSISKKGWDEGNFTPMVLTRDSIKAKRYWEQMSKVPMPIAIRYLTEYYCTDLSLEYEKLEVPTLVVIPSFSEELLGEKSHGYVSLFFHRSWTGAKEKSKNLHLITISDTNAFILEDQPKKLMEVINLFAENKLSPYDLLR